LQELAKALAPPHLPLKEIGIREGEKLHELLISPEEARFTLEFPRYYLLLPPLYQQSFETRKSLHGKEAKPVLESFSYSSDKNPEELKATALSLRFNVSS